MTNKQIMALVGAGVIAFSTVLCWPNSFDVKSAFYKAIFINISNMLISEIPKFKKTSGGFFKCLKILLTILGFVLMAIGIMNVSSTDALSDGDKVYFWMSALVCVISVINFIESMRPKESKKPKAKEYEPLKTE